jgi:glycerophosphoryl diester phosphodiesterase
MPFRRLLTVLASVAFLSVTGTSHAEANYDYNPLVSGHRGTLVGAPESTMAAFRYAKESGADIIEFDVYWTKATRFTPSYMVVIHDYSLDRTTNGTGNVIDKTWPQLKKLNAGDGQKIPLFKDVLAYAKANNLQTNAEIKGNINSAQRNGAKSTITNWQAKRYISVLKKYGMTNRNTMSSASKSIIRTIQKNDPDRTVTTALISYTGAETIREVQSYGHSYMPTWKRVSPATVGMLAQANVKTFIWPIQTKEDFEAAYATRAAVLVGNNPKDVVKWLKEK